MRFALENGLPYLISNGRAYPVEIKGSNVRYNKDASIMTDLKGIYTLEEIHAKCGKEVSSIKKRRTKAAEGI